MKEYISLVKQIRTKIQNKEKVLYLVDKLQLLLEQKEKSKYCNCERCTGLPGLDSLYEDDKA